MTREQPRTTDDPSSIARKQREAEFHDARYADDQRTRVSSIYRDTDFKKNYARRVLRLGAGKRVLEIGCGSGGLASKLEMVGANVTPIDISLEAARVTWAQHQVGSFQSRPVVADAEQLPFPGGSFDLIIGSGIVHHLDTVRFWAENRRVLANDGEAIFLEPLATNPVINAFRSATPRLRTVDEHPLTRRDLEDAATQTGIAVDVRFFHVTQLLSSAYTLATRRQLWSGLQKCLTTLDGAITHPRSPLRWLSWMAVIHLQKEGET